MVTFIGSFKYVTSYDHYCSHFTDRTKAGCVVLIYPIERSPLTRITDPIPMFLWGNSQNVPPSLNLCLRYPLTHPQEGDKSLTWNRSTHNLREVTQEDLMKQSLTFINVLI